MDYLLHHLLATSAGRHPNRTAVVDGDRTVTYDELDRRSNRLANVLLGLGVSRGDRVGVYLDKSIESVVGIYGILKCGASYVPFDPQAPVARLAYIMRNCGIRLLLTGAERAEAWDRLIAEAPKTKTLVVLNAGDLNGHGPPGGIHTVTAAELANAPDAAPAASTVDVDLAYILYTSGSTGEPKGVMVTHRAALAFVDWAADRFEVRAEDRLSSHAPLHFDLSVFDLFAASKAGASVALVPPKASVFPSEVARFMRERRITVWYSVPSVLSMLAQRGGLKPGDLPDLRTVLFAGEVFPTKYLRLLMRALPNVAFFNLYGPTETNVCTYYEVSPLSDAQTEAVPIGKAIANDDVFAMTEEGRLAEPGEPGELLVRGATLMRGYWGDPDRTAKSLLPNPLGGEVRDPVYKTGDLVVQEPDGNYRLLGRRDSQIKSRGYRIELGEIETSLYAHPSVIECAVTAVPDETFTNLIRAHVVTREPTSESDLVRFCAERIPRYMIPELFEFRESLPRTSTGKIDRQQLSTDLIEDHRRTL